MCLIFIAINQHQDYPVIIAANRDEFYARPTEKARFWPAHPHILAGKDLEAGGTWLGITRYGRFAAVTNFRENNPEIGINSRGQLVTDYLLSEQSNIEYTRKLAQTTHLFSGFNCVYGKLSQPSDLVYFSNRKNIPQQLTEGVYGLSNGLLDSDWPKVTMGKNIMRSLLDIPFEIDNWFALLNSRQTANNIDLPDTGVGLEKEKLLSPVFITGDQYGTRCSTIITLDHENIINFTERSYKPEGKIAEICQFNFEIITE